MLGRALPGARRAARATSRRRSRRSRATSTCSSPCARATGALLASSGRRAAGAPVRARRARSSTARATTSSGCACPTGERSPPRASTTRRRARLSWSRSRLAIALGAFPVVRRITRRLERLRAQVDALGAGELSARVDVRGKDEIASLARSFNRAAERIEKLVAAQRGALASASHELRSPLARIRVAIELVDGAEGDALRARGRPRRRGARRADRRAPAREPARRARARPGARPPRVGRPARARGRGGRAHRRRGRRRAGARRAATPTCCAGWCATCSRTRAATAAARTVEVWVDARAGRRAALASRTADPGSPRPSASGSSSRSTGPRARASRATAASASASRWCARSRATTAATRAAVAREGGGTVFEVELGGVA